MRRRPQPDPQGRRHRLPRPDLTRSNLIAEVEVTEELPIGARFDETGVHGLDLMEDGKTVRVVTTEPEIGVDTEPTLSDLSEALHRVFGTDFGVHNPRWISRFTDMTRQAVTYRQRRALLCGDAAHVHYPVGGQGLGLGVQDAVNLGWKLAQVVNGTSTEDILDTYHAERHPVTARILKHTMAQTALQRRDDRMQALISVVSEISAMAEPRAWLAGVMSGLDVHYDLGEGHPLLGRRMPDLDVVTANGPRRVFDFLHEARPTLLDFGSTCAISPWAATVQQIDATYDGEWQLPVIGVVSAPTALLIRPDGYIAWVGEGSTDGLTDALRTWFGPGRRLPLSRVNEDQPREAQRRQR